MELFSSWMKGGMGQFLSAAVVSHCASIQKGLALAIIVSTSYYGSVLEIIFTSADIALF